MTRSFLLTALAVVGLAGGSLGMAATAVPAAAPAAARMVASPQFVIPTFGCQGANQIPSSGSSGGIPVYHVTQPGCLSGIHACRVLGNDGTTQGVECADLEAEPSGTGVAVFAVAEGYCQNLSNTSDCRSARTSTSRSTGMSRGSPRRRRMTACSPAAITSSLASQHAIICA